MAIIHNKTGTVCVAKPGNCPMEGGHSDSIDGFVDYQEKTHGVSAEALRTAIADGAAPSEALEIVKLGDSHLEGTARSQATVEVEGFSGSVYKITPGVIDRESKSLYKTGQCMALAVELAEKTNGKVLLVTNLDGHIVHAHALHGKNVTDIEGSISVGDFKGMVKNQNKQAMRRLRSDDCVKVKSISPKKLKAYLEEGTRNGFIAGSNTGNVQKQNYDLARSFVDTLLGNK